MENIQAPWITNPEPYITEYYGKPVYLDDDESEDDENEEEDEPAEA